MKRRALVLVLALAAPALPPPPGFAQEVIRDTTHVIAVELPVHVIRDGRPLRGLTRDDFEVFEGRDKLPIVDFEVLDLGRDEMLATPGRYDLPGGARRHFLLLFDLSFSEVASVARARRAAFELVEKGLHPTDLVGVATYATARGAELVLGFTTDRRALGLALEDLGLAQPAERARDPLRILIAELETSDVLQLQDGPTGAAGAPDLVGVREAILLENLEDFSSFVGRDNQARTTNQVLALSASLGELAGYLASVQGRKHVVYLSEGFDASNLLGTDDAGRIAELADQAMAGEIWRVDSDERFGSGTSQSGLAEMLAAFRRADCTIQAVDIGGLRAGADVRERFDGEQGLFLMAEQTGGELYRNYNNLQDAMSVMLERTSVTYVLVLAARIVEADGSYHPLRVKLRKRKELRGARVVHRPGYVAARPYAERAPAEKLLSAAQLITAGGESGELFVTARATPLLAASDKTFVLAQVELDGTSLLRGHSGRSLPLEIYAYAMDASGAARDFFTQAVVLDLEQVGEQLESTGFKFLGRFDLVPGDYTVRALARHGISGSFGVRTVRLTVPVLAAGEAVLQPPLFPEAAGSWVLGWQTGDSDPLADYPLTVDRTRLVPSPDPVLFGGLDIPLLLVGRHLDDGHLTARGVIRSSDDGQVHPLEVALDRRLTDPAGGLQRYWAIARAGADLRPGRYELVVTLTDEASGRNLESSTVVLVQ